MSVYSMTGYASGQQSPPQAPAAAGGWSGAPARLALEIRSVNSRFLDLSFRLPDELRAHESALRELVGQHIKRGKVEVRGYVQGRTAVALGDPQPRVLQRLASLQDQITAWLPEAPRLSVAEAINLAGTSTEASSDFSDAVLPLATNVVEELVAARAREGARLAELLLERLRELRALSAKAAPMLPQWMEAHRQRFLERWAEALDAANATISAEARQDRALTEATAFAIRIDVAEELGRLNAHLDEIERVLAKGGEMGKRLDFLIQELHREANTLGSKSAALELTRIAVEMKVLIEQMREQVQNIE